MTQHTRYICPFRPLTRNISFPLLFHPYPGCLPLGRVLPPQVAEDFDEAMAGWLRPIIVLYGMTLWAGIAAVVSKDHSIRIVLSIMLYFQNISCFTNFFRAKLIMNQAYCVLYKAGNTGKPSLFLGYGNCRVVSRTVTFILYDLFYSLLLLSLF